MGIISFSIFSSLFKRKYAYKEYVCYSVIMFLVLMFWDFFIALRISFSFLKWISWLYFYTLEQVITSVNLIQSVEKKFILIWVGNNILINLVPDEI